jgi:hypothetical protein
MAGVESGITQNIPWQIAVIGLIAGALLTGILNILRDELTYRKKQRDNLLHVYSYLIGRKELILDSYNSYLRYFIQGEKKFCASIIAAKKRQYIEFYEMKKIKTLDEFDLYDYLNKYKEFIIAVEMLNRSYESRQKLAGYKNQFWEVMGAIKISGDAEKLSHSFTNIKNKIECFENLESEISNVFSLHEKEINNVLRMDHNNAENYLNIIGESEIKLIIKVRDMNNEFEESVNEVLEIIKDRLTENDINIKAPGYNDTMYEMIDH